MNVMSTITAALFVARKYINLHVQEEWGNNRGKIIDAWQKAFGLLGAPWCAIFVSSCLVEAGWPKDRLPSHPASVFGWWQWSVDKAILTIHPARGMLGFWLDRSEGGEWHGHIFWIAEVYSILGVKWVRTLEGNTNRAGSREGDGCYEKRRTLASLKRHARWGFIDLSKAVA